MDGTGVAGHVVENSTITQTGTGLVDDGQFCNSISYNTTTKQAAAPKFLNNKIYYAGGHGSLTILCGDGVLAQGNDIAHSAHGPLNFVADGSSCVSQDNQSIIGNIAHDVYQTAFGANGGIVVGPIPNTPSTLYCQNCNNALIANNVLYNVDDAPGCLTAQGTCNGIELYSGSGNQVLNNWVDTTFVGFTADHPFSGGNSSTGLVLKGNVFNIMPTVDNTHTFAEYFSDAIDPSAVVDFNTLGSSSIGFPINNGGTPTTLSNWQVALHDTHSTQQDSINVLPPALFSLMKLLETENR